MIHRTPVPIEVLCRISIWHIVNDEMRAMRDFLELVIAHLSGGDRNHHHLARKQNNRNVTHKK